MRTMFETARILRKRIRMVYPPRPQKSLIYRSPRETQKARSPDSNLKPMEIINRRQRMSSVARKIRREQDRTIGLVPTMGALHEGHLSLVREARRMCDVVVVSVFVNPAQFGPGEDFEHYPRDLTKDTALLTDYNVDFIFAPPVEEIYPKGFSTYVTVEGLSEQLEGTARPSHFRGVATVVTILLNVVRPDFAFFWPEGWTAGDHYPSTRSGPGFRVGNHRAADGARGFRIGHVFPQSLLEA